jgi:hypothetical protein
MEYGIIHNGVEERFYKKRRSTALTTVAAIIKLSNATYYRQGPPLIPRLKLSNVSFVPYCASGRGRKKA